MNPLKKLWNAIFEKRYLSLTSSLFFFLILPPFLRDLPILKYVILILYSIIILYCILIITGRSKVNVFHIVFLIAMIMTWANLNNLVLQRVHYMLAMVVYGTAAMKIITQLIKIEKVDEKALLAAIGRYLLIGLSGSYLIAFIATIDSNAFNIPDVYSSVYNYVYFSFVTLTTLGYGDFIPLTPQAKSISILISLVGQIYLTILMAILVGKYMLYYVNKG